MTKNYFKDLIFQILNENDTHIANIEVHDKDDLFQITCIDNTKFFMSIQEENDI